MTEVPGEDPPLRSKIEGLLTASLPGNLLSSDAMLGMSPRTLARRLQEAGTSYRAIVDDLRCDMAKTLIKDDMSLTEIAFALGYSDQAAFSTAFRRWTGFASREYAATHAFFQNDLQPQSTRSTRPLDGQSLR
ncbi:MAG: helix-turn-helix transcriptional regulator [Rhodobacteraceae bacterium]|nr:helix-turn-helix transcriptional regulator [Paracoccaceae bacterium]